MGSKPFGSEPLILLKVVWLTLKLSILTLIRPLLLIRTVHILLLHVLIYIIMLLSSHILLFRFDLSLRLLSLRCMITHSLVRVHLLLILNRILLMVSARNILIGSSLAFSEMLLVPISILKDPLTILAHHLELFRRWCPSLWLPNFLLLLTRLVILIF